jgi:hypothetical protein
MEKKMILPELGTINKEFVPVLLILATPMLAFMNGFGIKTASIGVDVFYAAALVFGVFMGRLESKKITNIYEFFLLLAVEVAVSLPYMKYDNYFNGNFTYLIISYSLIVLFYVLIAYSFFINDPYFTGYYCSDKETYITIFKIIALFFVGVTLYHIYLFTKILEILKFTGR